MVASPRKPFNTSKSDAIPEQQESGFEAGAFVKRIDNII
jgi:hypothetical protein